MTEKDLDFTISKLGECRIPSPMRTDQFVGDDEHVLYHDRAEVVRDYIRFRQGNPLDSKWPGREKGSILIRQSSNAASSPAAVFCPGMNDVIRSVVLSLTYHYGVRTIYGFRYGYEGLIIVRWATRRCCSRRRSSSGIHDARSRFLLGTSRGEQNVAMMVNTLVEAGVNMLFHRRRRWHPARRSGPCRRDRSSRAANRRGGRARDYRQ